MRIISADRTTDVNYDLCTFEIEENDDEDLWHIGAYMNLLNAEECGYFIMGTYNSQIEAIAVMDMARQHLLSGGKIFIMPTPIEMEQDDEEEKTLYGSHF